MDSALRILHLEDDPLDTEMVRNMLRKEGLPAEIERVATAAAFKEALQGRDFALILSDYSIPGTNTQDLLRLARELRPEVPFVFLSGTMGEDLGVEMLKLGAGDFVLKQRIARLVPAIRRALQEAEELARRKQAEAALRQSEARFRSLFENSPDAIFMTISDGRIVAANPAAQAIFGMSEEELCLRGREGLADPEDPRFARALEERLRTGRFTGVELNYVRKNGERFSAEVSSVVLPGGDAQSFVILRDITQRKQAEAALRQSEDKFRSFFERASIGMGRVSFTDARWIDVNDAFCRMLGYSHEELLSIPWPQTTHPEDLELDLVPFRRMAAGELESYAVEKRFIHKQGHHVWANLTLSLVRDLQGRPDYEIAIIEDITDRKQAEEALRRSEERLRSVLENSLDAAYRRDLRTDTYDYLSPVIEQVMGISVEAMRSLPTGGLIERIHPEDRPRVREAVEESIRSGKGRVEYRFMTDAGHYRWMADHFTVQTDGAGVPLFRGGTVRDVTEQKLAETALRQANSALAEADRRKDEFLAMLAHELRNPLAPVRNAVQILNMVSPKESLLQRQRDIIDRQVRHMARLLDDLLDVSRITRGKITLKKERVKLVDVLARAVETATPLIEAHRHRLSVNIHNDKDYVFGDFDRLIQMIGNLLTNAAKYTEEEGQIWLETDRENGRIAIRVRDTGMGIAPDLLPKVFDVFTQAERSLDRAQGGLGLGLTLVRSLTQMHGGSVEAHSAGSGQGSEFIIRLPALAPAEKPELPCEMPGVQPTGPARRIMVVDDVIDTANSLAELLGMMGHEVKVAYDGHSALKLANQFTPDVILLDIGLPGMNGFEVARQIRREPSLEGAILVALTGYGQEEDRRRAQEAGFDRHMTKPVELEQLQNILHESQAA